MNKLFYGHSQRKINRRRERERETERRVGADIQTERVHGPLTGIDPFKWKKNLIIKST